MAAWAKRSWATKKNLKFCYIVTAILILLGYGLATQMTGVKDIMIKYKSAHKEWKHEKPVDIKFPGSDEE